jgi:hypothetical protein
MGMFIIRRVEMMHLFLALLIVFGVKAFGKEDSTGYFDEKTDASSVVRTYCPLAPDAIDKIYDSKKDSHRIAIVRKEDMPVCLQTLPGPFPFHGHSGDVRLGSLKTDYFAALQFDKPEIQRETERMREGAEKIRSRNPVEALQLLYNAGWKMGDPASVKMLSDLIREMRNRDDAFIHEDSNLISVLDTYPGTVDAVVRTIRASRGAVDYKDRKSPSETFSTDSDEEPFELEVVDNGEGSSLLETYTLSGLRRRA